MAPRSGCCLPVGARPGDRRRPAGRPGSPARPGQTTMVALAVATVGSLLWIEVDFDSYLDAFTLLPLAALGIGAGIARSRSPATPGLPRGGGAECRPADRPGCALLGHRPRPPVGPSAGDHRAAGQHPARPDLVHRRPEYLVLARRANPRATSSSTWASAASSGPPGPVACPASCLEPCPHPDLVVVSDLEMRNGYWKSILSARLRPRGPLVSRLLVRAGSLGRPLLRSIRGQTRAIAAATR